MSKRQYSNVQRDVSLLSTSLDTSTQSQSGNTICPDQDNETPQWIHVSELFIPLLPFRCDPNWNQVKFKIGVCLEILRDKTRAPPVNKRLAAVAGKRFAMKTKPQMSENEIRNIVLSLMTEIATLHPNTIEQMVWILQLMCRFYLQKYKPEPGRYLSAIMEKIRDWEPDLWDDKPYLKQISYKIHYAIGPHLANLNYVYNYLAFTNPYLHHIFTIICCVKMREIILNEFDQQYAPITPRQVLSLANTFNNLHNQQLDLHAFNNFLIVFSMYLRLVTRFKDLTDEMPDDMLEKYYKPSQELLHKMEHWTDNLIKFMDFQIQKGFSAELLVIREVLEFDILATIKGKYLKSRSILWISQRASQ